MYTRENLKEESLQNNTYSLNIHQILKPNTSNSQFNYKKSHSIKQCSYRFQEQSYQISVLSNTFQNKPISKVCRFRNKNIYKSNKLQSNADQFSYYIQTFYQDDFYQKFIANPTIHSTFSIRSQNSSIDCKVNEDDNVSVPTFIQNRSSETSYVNKSQQDILKNISNYLYEIRTQFGHVLDAQNENKFIKLQVKVGCENQLCQNVNQIVKQFLKRARESKSSKKLDVPINQNQEISQNRNQTDCTFQNQAISEQGDSQFNNSECNSKQIPKNEFSQVTEQQNLNQQSEKAAIYEDNPKKSVQSQYHNLKNSFMQLIVQLLCEEVLNCFDLSQFLQESAEQIINRMKINSFKYRKVKGKYHYYSNIHYLTLFLKFTENNFQEIKQDPLVQQYHKIFFQEDILECSSVTDIPIIKCNYFKLLIGQIITHCLEIAENELQSNVNFETASPKIPQNHSRFFYINKVKKGIQKLQNGKQIIRF